MLAHLHDELKEIPIFVHQGRRGGGRTCQNDHFMHAVVRIGVWLRHGVTQYASVRYHIKLEDVLGEGQVEETVLIILTLAAIGAVLRCDTAG